MGRKRKTQGRRKASSRQTTPQKQTATDQSPQVEIAVSEDATTQTPVEAQPTPATSETASDSQSSEATLIAQLTQQLNDAQSRIQDFEAAATPQSAGSQTVLASVQALLQAHEELQPKKTLQRIEDKLDDLRDRSFTSVVSGSVEAPAAEQDKEPSQPAAVQDDTSSWAEMRARVMGESLPQETQETEVAARIEDDDDTPAAFSGVIAPEPIDVDSADNEALRRAVDERDAYAICLLHQMRNFERRRLITATELQELDGQPEQAAQALSEVEARLNDVLRMAEVEVSMERARISRETARLQRLQYQVSKDQARLDQQREDMEVGPAQPQKKSNRKWLKAMGFAKDE